MIPYNAKVKLMKTTTDRWGISVPDAEETHKAFLNYSLKLKGVDSVGKEVLPEGSLIVKGFNSITPDDYASWEVEGKVYKVKPEDVSYIKDGTGKVMFTKVTF